MVNRLALIGCGDEKTLKTTIAPKASICEQANQSYEQAAEKFPELKKSFCKRFKIIVY